LTGGLRYPRPASQGRGIPARGGATRPTVALDDEYGVDGLFGMNFLENDNFTVRPRDRQIHLEPVEAGESPPAG
jgi:hypothetical protein